MAAARFSLAAARLLRVQSPCSAARARSFATARVMAAPLHAAKETPPPAGMSQVLFVQMGMGTDQHGQDVTKAAVRAVHHAIENNRSALQAATSANAALLTLQHRLSYARSIPCIKRLVPNGYDGVKVHVKLGVPIPDKMIDEEAIKKCFPYGTVSAVEVVHGGLACCSGVMIPGMGDAEDAMVVAVAAVTVGH